MATSSKGKVNYNSSSGNIEFHLESTNTQLGSGEYAILTMDGHKDHDEHAYASLGEPYMNANLGESPNEEKDTKRGEWKVKTTMTRSPNSRMCMFAAVILLLVIGTCIGVFLVVYLTSKGFEVKNCGVPGNMENAEVIGLFNTTYNNTFYVKCNEGYELNGSSIISCTSSGVLDELPTCEMVSCGLPDIPTNASILDITGTSFKASVTLKCDEGFYLDGTSEIRCQSNRLWTNYPTCKGYCTEQLIILHGKIVNKTGSFHGDSFDVLCNDGHQISGPTSVTCLSSNKWSKQPTCDCKEFQKAPQNGRISAKTETNASIACNAGYILSGPSEIHRLSNGCWSKGPVCVRNLRCTVQPGQFTGALSYTTGGYTCQRWDTQSPHKHGYWRNYLFPDGSASAAENHCRALGEDYLWCYTTNRSVRWKKCTRPDYVC